MKHHKLLAHRKAMQAEVWVFCHPQAMACSSKGTSEQQGLSGTSGSMVSDGHTLYGSASYKALTLLWSSYPYSFTVSAMNRKVLCGRSGCSTKMARPGILGCAISCTHGQSKENSTATMAPFKMSLLLSASSSWALLPLHPHWCSVAVSDPQGLASWALSLLTEVL